MTTAAHLRDLLTDLAAAGLALAVDGVRLRFRPATAMTPELAARVTEVKAEIIALLRRAGGGPFDARNLALVGGSQQPIDAALNVPIDLQAWGEVAVEHYLNRMATAEDLGMDIGPVSEAEGIARREALRVACYWPMAEWPSTREATLSDELLALATHLFGPRTPAEARPHDPKLPQFGVEPRFPAHMPCPAASCQPVIERHRPARRGTEAG